MIHDYNRSAFRTVKQTMAATIQKKLKYRFLFLICLLIVGATSQVVRSQHKMPSDTIPKDLEITIWSQPIGAHGAETRHTISKDRTVEISTRGGLPTGIVFGPFTPDKGLNTDKSKDRRPLVQKPQKLPHRISKSTLKTILSNLSELNFASVGEKPDCNANSGGRGSLFSHYARKTIFVRFGRFQHVYASNDSCGPKQNQAIYDAYDLILSMVSKVERKTVEWDSNPPQSQTSLKQESLLLSGKIPKDLEIIIGSGRRGHGYEYQYRTVIRTDRKVEWSYSCGGGCLPRDPRSVLSLLALTTGKSITNEQKAKEKAKRERAERKRIASLESRVPKSTIRDILKQFMQSRFFNMNKKSMFCKVENYPQSGQTRSISINYEGFSMILGASEGCDLERAEKNEQRIQFIALYDFILASLKNVRRDEVPLRSDIERKLRGYLEKGEMPHDLEIIAESDEGGLGTRIRLIKTGILTKASYSTRNTVVLDGMDITERDERRITNPRKPPKLKKRVPKQSKISILKMFLKSGFFQMQPNLRGDFYVSGSQRYTMISIRLDGLTKQTRCETACQIDNTAPCVEFCGLYAHFNESVEGVSAAKESW